MNGRVVADESAPPPADKVARLPLSAKAAPPRASHLRRYVVAGVMALLFAAAAAAIVWWMAGARTSVHYTTAPVTRGDVTHTVTATGTVNPELTIIVGTYVSGVIQELYCDYNTVVKKGQICARIDPRPYQTVVDQNKAALEIAKAQLLKDRANLEYARISYERNARLVKSNAVSQDAVDNARSAYDQAQAQIVFDQATIQQRQAALDAAQVNLDYTRIVSPVDGVVVSRSVTMGQTVAASFQTPTLFLIATDLTRMQVDTNVSESDVGDIKMGNASTFTVDAFPKRTFNGAVSQVRQSPQTVQNVVTYDIVVSVDNSDLALKPGMTAAARIIADQRNNVVRVPNQALRYRPEGSAADGSARAQVFVLQDGEPVAVPVVPGLDDDNFTEILSGDIAPGMSVIVAQRSTASPRAAVPRLRF